MKATKLFYLFNILLSLYLLAPSLILGKIVTKNEVAKVETLDDALAKAKKKKEYLLYGGISLAALVATLAIAGGVYYGTRGKPFTTAETASESDKILEEVSRKVEEQLRDLVRDGKDLEKEGPQVKDVQKLIKDQLKESKVKFNSNEKKHLAGESGRVLNREKKKFK